MTAARFRDLPAPRRTLHPRQSEAAARSILDWVWHHYDYQADDQVYGRREWWSGAMAQLRTSGQVRDDCDGFSRLVISLLVMAAGFSLSDCFECVVDSTDDGDDRYDHHVGAVRIGTKLRFFHCWANALLSREALEEGAYLLPGAVRAPGIIIKGHRRIDHSNALWRPGVPRI